MTAAPCVGVVGVGYVGLTTAVCLAERGLDTVAVDIDADRVRRLAAGTAVIDEPELPGLLRQGLHRGLLHFSTDYAALGDRDVVFVCVSTPSGKNGQADLSAVRSAVDGLSAVLRPGAVVAVKSTVPVGTTTSIAQRLSGNGIRVVSTPEFLREGHAVHDFRRPDRLVIGTRDETVARLVRHCCPGSAPVQQMSPESAELAKYASNAFLAVKLSYANSLATLCARVGADIDDVTGCMGADARIGGEFLAPGPGWGGSCLPKDTAALVHAARAAGVAFGEVEAARFTNKAQPGRIVRALRRAAGPLAGSRITALGLTFKAEVSDTRDSPALAACAEVARLGAQVFGYDPRLGDIDPAVLRDAEVTAVDEPYRATKAADAIVVLTDWPEIRQLDWYAVAREAPAAIVVDTRNLLDPAMIRATGLGYLGNGVPGGF
jgi:UDPglucose 6-dehydrogenase